MSRPDIAALDLKEADPQDWDGYEPPKAGTGAGAALLPKGEYLVSIDPESIEWGKDKNDLLQITCTLKVIDGEHTGAEMRYQRFGIRKYPFRKGSEAGDLILACRIGTRPTNNAEWMDALTQCAGVPFKAYGDWEAYDKTTGKSVKGMENFPVNDKGERMSFIKKVDGDSGMEYIVWGNWRYRRVSPAE